MDRNAWDSSDNRWSVHKLKVCT